MRDAAISNAQKRARQSVLDICIAQTTQEYTRTPTPTVHRRLELAKMELNLLYTSQAEYALQRLKGHHYEHSEKAGRLLAAQLRQREAVLAIPALRNPDGSFITHPQAIAEEFGNFYRTLYTPKTTDDIGRLEAFLDRANIPCLSDEGRALLEGICFVKIGVLEKTSFKAEKALSASGDHKKGSPFFLDPSTSMHDTFCEGSVFSFVATIAN
ncbi:hypothetical protein NDU88_000879 [Pleurodeles waltl]|uniref:Uncharacterized protein n=1 Tax=Pleurodeles waltl TaxID=8319 RepID=A0AAV7SXM4_PLEWA|nr:hypothetical protein NDU88_000879 [Pleurodeles waltl]